MVDYYYGRWEPGRVHEVRLHPLLSSQYDVVRTSGSGPWASQPPTGSRFKIKGVEWISGGALPPLNFSHLSGQVSNINWAGSADRRGELYNGFGGATPLLPAEAGYMSAAVSQEALAEAVTGDNGHGAISASEPGYGGNYDIAGSNGKLGWVHFGWHRLYTSGLGDYGPHHYETWALQGHTHPLFPTEGGFTRFQDDDGSGVYDLEWAIAGAAGVGPDRSDWPDEVSHVEVESLDRTLLDVSVQADLQAGLRLIHKRVNDATAIDFPGPLQTALTEYSNLDVSVEDWEQLIASNDYYDKRMELAIVPEIPVATMAVDEGGLGPVTAHVVESMLKSPPHDFYVSVKFRTAPWRYVYSVEPSITGTPDNVRRRFT